MYLLDNEELYRLIAGQISINDDFITSGFCFLEDLPVYDDFRKYTDMQLDDVYRYLKYYEEDLMIEVLIETGLDMVVVSAYEGIMFKVTKIYTYR